jgi:tRNA(fMet)-specific endonuclease VapC
MTLRCLLDTGIAATPLGKSPDPEVVRKLGKRSAECAIPAPVWSELLLAVEALKPGSEPRVATERYLHEVLRRSFPILPFDDAAAAWHGREIARRARSGSRVGVVDSQIAAIAVVGGLTLVTTSPQAYAGYPGLRVERWGGRGGG